MKGLPFISSDNNTTTTTDTHLSNDMHTPSDDTESYHTNNGESGSSDSSSLHSFNQIEYADTEEEFSSPPTSTSNIIRRNFTTPPYMTNYFSVLDKNNENTSSLVRRKLKLKNEFWLKKYYLTKIVNKNITTTTNNNDKVTNDENLDFNVATELLNATIEKELDSILPKDFENTIDLKNFKKYEKYYIDEDKHQSYTDQLGKYDITSSIATSAYNTYYKSLEEADPIHPSLLKNHTLWVPSVRRSFRDYLINFDPTLKNYYSNKTTVVFNQGSSMIPKKYDAYSGGTFISSIFGKQKLPTLTYHCTIATDSEIITIGGLRAFHASDDDMPNLDDFVVHGIEDLPPPLLPDIINNPIMIPNPNVYVKSITFSTVRTPKLLGSIPPPLLGMKGTQISPRYVFFFGGFELTTTVKYDPKTGKYHLYHGSVINDKGYILDILQFKFTKIDIVSAPNSNPNDDIPSTLVGRFGHVVASDDTEDVPPSLSPSSSAKFSNFMAPASPSTPKPPSKLYNSNSNITPIPQSPSSSDDANNLSDNSSIYSTKKTPVEYFSLNHYQNNNNNGKSPYSPISNSISHKNISKCNSNNHYSKAMVKTVYVFGGYYKTVDDKYETLNDFWRIELPILSRSKRGYCKFSNVGKCIPFPIPKNPNIPWPPKRGFCAYYISNKGIVPGSWSPEESALSKLENEFKMETESLAAIGSTRRSYEQLSQLHLQKDYFNNNKKSSSSSFTNRNNNKQKTTIFRNSQQYYKMNPANDVVPDNNDKQKRLPRMFVIHGGSNGKKVLGDMWWFDIDNIEWRKIQTYASVEGYDKKDMLPLDIPLVGHSMGNVGHMAVCVGGLIQRDVDILYSNDLTIDVNYINEGYKARSKLKGIALGSAQMKIFNLFSGAFQSTIILREKNLFEKAKKNGYKINADSVRVISDCTTHDIMNIACTIAQCDGSLMMIGGLTAKRWRPKKFYMRGAIMEFMLPSIDTVI